VVECIDDLRILGMRFAVDGKMEKHVDYWLDRGLGVRTRIGALARRFGGFGGLGSWEVMRLVQGAYLPVVEYGLEFVASDKDALHRIEVHVRDCLKSLFRLPLRLANNILHSECGIPPSRIRANYIWHRFAQRFLNYGYCALFPWHGSIRNNWLIPGMSAVRIDSDAVLTTTPQFHCAPDKDTGLSESQNIIASLASSPTLVGFVDGSNKGTGCGCAWAAYRGRVELRLGSSGLPPDWDIDTCELFAILSFLRDILALRPKDVVLFTDSQAAITMLRAMRNTGTTSGIWHAFAPILSLVPNMVIRVRRTDSP